MTTRDSAEAYYERLILDISEADLTEWENSITFAEATRMQDITVMDILASKKPRAADVSADIDVREAGEGVEWMRMALNIEEKQYVCCASWLLDKHNINFFIELKFRIAFGAFLPILQTRRIRKYRNYGHSYGPR